MSRFYAGLVASAIVVVLVSCDDDPESKPVTPTAPVVAPALSPVAALSAAPTKVKGSSVCASYLRERTKLLAKLDTTPQNIALLRRAKSLAEVITDACN